MKSGAKKTYPMILEVGLLHGAKDSTNSLFTLTVLAFMTLKHSVLLKKDCKP